MTTATSQNIVLVGVLDVQRRVKYEHIKDNYLREISTI